MNYKTIAGIIPTIQSANLVNENLKGIPKKDGTGYKKFMDGKFKSKEDAQQFIDNMKGDCKFDIVPEGDMFVINKIGESTSEMAGSLPRGNFDDGEEALLTTKSGQKYRVILKDNVSGAPKFFTGLKIWVDHDEQPRNWKPKK